MTVLKITHDGNTYYVKPDSCAIPVGAQVDLINMTEDEYRNIPATHEAYVFVMDHRK